MLPWEEPKVAFIISLFNGKVSSISQIQREVEVKNNIQEQNGSEDTIHR